MGNERRAEERNTLGQARLPGTLGMRVDREQQRPRFYATGEPSSDPAARIIERWAANHADREVQCGSKAEGGV